MHGCGGWVNEIPVSLRVRENRPFSSCNVDHVEYAVAIQLNVTMSRCHASLTHTYCALTHSLTHSLTHANIYRSHTYCALTHPCQHTTLTHTYCALAHSCQHTPPQHRYSQLVRLEEEDVESPAHFRFLARHGELAKNHDKLVLP